MLKKIQLLFAFALALPAASYGIVGGPFDNGDYSTTLDDTGIYQASLRFSNGQGMAQFATNADFSPYRLVTGTATTLPSNYGSYLNRSIIYYKGVTYLGTATGIVDHNFTNTVEGYTNGNSDVTTTTSNGTQGTPTSVDSTTTLLGNGQRYITCNTAWTAQICARSPILRFKGKGELTVIGPDAGTATGGIVTNLVNSLTTLLTTGGGGTPSPGTGPQGSYTASEINQINATLLTIRYLTTGQLPTFDAAGNLTSTPTDLPPEAALPKTADLVQQASDQVPVTVYGTRKFFGTGIAAATIRR